MRKLIGKYIIMIMICVSCGLIGAFYWLNTGWKEHTELRFLESCTEQVISILKSNEEKDKTALKLFENDYIHRANSIAYVIDQTMDNDLTSVKLQKLAKLNDVEEIYIVDENGTIKTSSQTNMIGVSFYKVDLLKKFIPLIESKKTDDYYVELDGYDIKSKKEMVYIGVKPFQSKKGMIQIAVEPKILMEYKQKSSISSTISSMPTREYVTIFVLDEKTGELLGITKNNTQTLDFGEIEKQDVLSYLKQYIGNSGKIIINGEEKLIDVKEWNGNLIGVTSDSEFIRNSSLQYLMMVTLIVVVLTIIVIVCLYKLLDYFIISDIERMVDGVNAFLNGNGKVEFHANKKTELYKMTQGLNKWVESYANKSERISKVVSMMGNTYATYEYFDDLHQVFYSDNLPDMLEVSEKECEEFILEKYSHDTIKNVMNRHLDKPEEDVIITKSGRHLKIQRMTSGNTYYAIIRDISEEQKEHEKLSNALYEANEKASRDVLTGLYNRNKAEELINTWFQDGKKTGVMLLMDLDNFKKVNDEKGHPEGDVLLKKFAHIVLHQFRDSDVKARIGGDEFVVFLPNCVEKSILKEKLNSFLINCRQELRQYYMEQGLSVSIGVAYATEMIHSYDELYHSADSAMYVAKKHGKDGYFINEE